VFARGRVAPVSDCRFPLRRGVRAGLNVYTVVKNRTLVLTTAALAEVTERLTRPIKR
jgi:ribosomal protein L4